MPSKGPLALPADVEYLYDGSLAGFFCCVHESVYSGEIPALLQEENLAQPSLFIQKQIITNGEKAEKVKRSIREKISPRALELVQTVFLSCLEEKELQLLRFLLLAYREGPMALRMLGHPQVSPIIKAEQHLLGERHLLLGFIRFSDYDGVLGATISPKNFVLPFLANHFISRFAGEEFIIFDKTHKAALLYQNRKQKIIPVEDICFPPENEREEQFQALWKQFYKTISIEARENPTCRMTHMPKRYWENMTEMKELL